jgi:hypothetical protein
MVKDTNSANYNMIEKSGTVEIVIGPLKKFRADPTVLCHEMIKLELSQEDLTQRSLRSSYNICASSLFLISW